MKKGDVNPLFKINYIEEVVSFAEIPVEI